MKVLKIGITGSDNFIGDKIIKVLESRNRAIVYGLKTVDVFDISQLKKFVKNKDVVVHAAAVHRGDDAAIIEGNAISACSLVLAIKKSKTYPKIIFISSTQAKGESLYGQSKKIAETVFKKYSETEKIPVAVLRVANEFGEGASPFYNSVVATFCYQLANGWGISVSPSSKKFNFVYSGDIANSVVDVIFKKMDRFSIKEIKSKTSITITRLASILKSFPPQESKPILKSKLMKDLYSTYLSYQKNERKT